MAHLDDEQHCERLDMDNDFEGGEFIGGEFFHRGKRQRKQQPKDDQLYGVFADDSGGFAVCFSGIASSLGSRLLHGSRFKLQAMHSRAQSAVPAASLLELPTT